MKALFAALKAFLTLPTVSTLVRAGLKFGGGFLVAKGLANGEQVETAVAAVLTLVGVIWGIAAKKPELPPADGAQ